MATRPQGRDELNLIDFPIATLQHQQPVGEDGKRPDELVCEINSYDPELDRLVPRKLTRRTSSKHGFPTPLEDEVLIGLLSITRFHNNFTSPRAEFRNGELFDLMGWPHNGASNQRLSIALDRLSGIKLKYENSWTTEDGAFHKEFSTGILEAYEFTQQTHGRRRADREKSWIQWSSEVFSDIQRGNVKELDTKQFYSLGKPISQRLYRILDRHLSATPSFEIELTTLAAHLGFSELRHVGKIKQRLATAITELERLSGFITPCSSTDRYYKRGPGDWGIRFERPASSSSSAGGRKSAITRRTSARSLLTPDDAERLVTEFYRLWCGVDRHTPTRRELQQAQEVIDNYGAESCTQLLPTVIKRMKKDFPTARVFGATMVYWGLAANSRKLAEGRSPPAESLQADVQWAEDRNRRKALLTEWEKLDVAQQKEILAKVRKTVPPAVKRMLDEKQLDDAVVRVHCLTELGRRLNRDCQR